MFYLCHRADRYNGPSFIVAYAPCIQQQVRPDGLTDMFDECRYAVDSGYWPLYRYNPDLIVSGKNPFILDSKKLRKEVTSFLKREGRFINLKKAHPEIADNLFHKMNTGETFLAGRLSCHILIPTYSVIDSIALQMFITGWS